MTKTTSLILTAFAAAGLFASVGTAQTVQTTAAANYDFFNGYGGYGGYEYGSSLLGSVTLAPGTETIDDIAASMTLLVDQGWGGTGVEGVNLMLNDNGTILFNDRIATATHDAQSVNFDLAADDATNLAALNAALGTADWSSGNVTVDLVAQPVGWDGWELHIQNATETVTSTAPEGASTVALFGAVLTGFAVVRRKLFRA